jgi:hypothetical protein
MSPKAKMAAVLLMTVGLVLGAATAALAHQVSVKIHCNEVRVMFTFFPDTGTHSATVTIGGVETGGGVHSISWTGSTHTRVFPITAQNGDVVTADVVWESSDGFSGTVFTTGTVMDCEPGPSPSPSPSPSPTTSPSPSPSPTTSPSPSPSPSPTTSPSPSPSPTTSPSPSPTSPAPPPTSPPAPPGGGEAEVQPQVVQPKPGGQAVGQAQGGQVAAGALAFTGPSPAVPMIGSLAALSFLTGLAALMWGGKYRGVHRAS